MSDFDTYFKNLSIHLKEDNPGNKYSAKTLKEDDNYFAIFNTILPSSLDIKSAYSKYKNKSIEYVGYQANGRDIHPYGNHTADEFRDILFKVESDGIEI